LPHYLFLFGTPPRQFQFYVQPRQLNNRSHNKTNPFAFGLCLPVWHVATLPARVDEEIGWVILEVGSEQSIDEAG